VGPITIQERGPLTSAQSFQLNLLSICAISGAAIFAFSGFRIRGLWGALTPMIGFLVLCVGVFVFLYTIPNPGDGAPCGNNCGLIVPYSLQGEAIASWGFCALIMGLTIRFLSERQLLGDSLGIPIGGFASPGGITYPPPPPAPLVAPPPFPPPPPPPPSPRPPPLDGRQTVGLYEEILRKTHYWQDIVYRHLRAGFILIATATCLTIVAGTGEFIFGPLAARNGGLVGAIVHLALPAIAGALILGYMAAQLNRFRTLFDRVESGAVLRRSLLASPPELAMRRWMQERQQQAESERPAPNPSSDLTRALTLLQFGGMLGRWARALVSALFLAYLVLGLVGAVLLAFALGALDPELPGFPITILLGPIIVIVLSYWFLHRADQEIDRLTWAFWPLLGAGSWLEQVFWSNY
jgi:hypothetical protein